MKNKYNRIGFYVVLVYLLSTVISSILFYSLIAWKIALTVIVITGGSFFSLFYGVMYPIIDGSISEQIILTVILVLFIIVTAIIDFLILKTKKRWPFIIAASIIFLEAVYKFITVIVIITEFHYKYSFLFFGVLVNIIMFGLLLNCIIKLKSANLEITSG